MKRISVVIPVYRSEDGLGELLRRLSQVIDLEKDQIILVNDCSPDKSWDVICDLAKKYHGIIGVNLRKNVGQDCAIMAGLRLAAGDLVVIMDDDLQHNPEDIPKLISALDEFDVCYGDFTKKYHSLWKRIGSWLNGKASEWLMDKPKDIYLSPFKALSADLKDEICKYVQAYPYVDGLILRVTSRITKVELEHHERKYGYSNFTLVKSFKVWLRHVTGFSTHPLRVASIFGFMTSISGFFLLLYFLSKYFMGSDVPIGWTSLVSVTLFLNGILLISIGMIGEYVGKSYLNLNQKPQYSVREVIKSAQN